MLYHLRTAVARLRELFRRSEIASERDEEFEFHLDMQIAYNVRAGMSEPDARRAALLRFGGTQRFREATADAAGCRRRGGRARRGICGSEHGERRILPRHSDGMPRDSRPLPYVPRGAQYVVRADQPPAARTIQRLVTAIDPRVPAVDIGPLGALVDSATARVRLTMLLIAVAGGAALLLGVIGVYSVVSYAAAGRVREFGIRLALGAAPSRVGSMVMRDGMALVAVGTIAGLAAAVSASRFLRSLLYEVTPTSVAEFALATALLVGVSLVATLLPARRSARTSPAVVLRGE